MPDKTPTMYINVIIDESGSMQFCRQDTIDGLNEYIQEQKKTLTGKVYFSLTKFNTTCTQVMTATPLKDVKELILDDYNPDGMTALYDAVGLSIKAIDKRLERETGDVAVLVIIITDGKENHSTEYNHSSIVDLIESKKAEKNWTFTFMGAEIDAYAQGASISVSGGNTMQYHKANTIGTYQVLSRSTQNYAKSVAAGGLQVDAFFDGKRHIDMGSPDSVEVTGETPQNSQPEAEVDENAS